MHQRLRLELKQLVNYSISRLKENESIHEFYLSDNSIIPLKAVD